ncbi:peptidase inhibitor family I36 protein [Streptomyces sp. NPDC002644]
MRRSGLALLCGLALMTGLSSAAAAAPAAAPDAAPVAAAAAKGQFHWIGAKGKPYFVENPPSGKCLSMAEKGRAPQNRTSSAATVYTGKKCNGTAKRLAPGQRAPQGVAFASVRFGK